MIIQSDNFTYKDYSCALNLDGFKARIIDEITVSATMPAIWFKRSKGTVAICEGHIGGRYYRDENYADLDYFMDNFSIGSRSGTTRYKWNGEEIWADTSIYERMVKAHDRLDPMLVAFNETKAIPAGYTGWYCLRSITPPTRGGACN